MKWSDQQMRQDGVAESDAAPRARTYDSLVRLSRRMGRVAMRPIVGVRAIWASLLSQNGSKPVFHRPEGVASRSDEGGSPGGGDVHQRGQQDELVGREDLSEVVRQSNEVLASANTVFPMTLFPDTVFVDRSKVTIIRRDFFWSSDTISIRIEDILNVSASVGPLFGSLTVASRVMSTVDHFKINYFWRNDAIHLKHIIQGYVIAQHDRLSTASLSAEELVKLLENLGHDTNN